MNLSNQKKDNNKKDNNKKDNNKKDNKKEKKILVKGKEDKVVKNNKKETKILNDNSVKQEVFNILPTNSKNKIDSILTKKGYEIVKKTLDDKELEVLKKELTVEPYIPGEENVKSFPVFSETKTKITIPRFYGIKKYGLPKSCSLTYTSSNYKFLGSLRENQVKIMDKTIPYLNQNYGGILSVPCAMGKCLIKGTKIMMYTGVFKNVEDIKVGDLLMGDDSTPRRVLSLARGREEMFDIIPTKGEKYTVNRSHILSLKWGTERSESINKIKYKKGDIIDISVDDYLKLPKMFNESRASPLRGYRVPIDFPKRDVLIDPYMIGYWLGDGDSSGSIITTAEKEVVDYFTENLKKYDLNLKQGKRTETTRHDMHYKITSGAYDSDSEEWTKDDSKLNKFTQSLKYYNLINNKHIPYEYKCNSREVRLAVLAGLIDSDGSLNHNKKGYDLCLKNEKLLDDVIYLSRSLGFACYKTECKRTCTNAPNGPKEGIYYRTFITGNNIHEVPVLLERKKALYKSQAKDPLNYGITVKSVGIGDYYGFEIDGNRRFVLGDFTVTHNTVMTLYLGAYLQAKMFVVVHKSFLLDQWVSRAKQFTDAKVGILRQNKIPDPDCDIVIGMIQSISMKDYEDKIFEGFKLLVVDECFPYRQNILTEKGPIEIGKLHELWSKNENLPLIKSFNEKTQTFEYKKMTYAWRKKAKKLIKIHIGKKKIICTPNHKFLTNNGYIEANKLNNNHLLYGIYNNRLDENVISRCLNDDQLQVVLGSFLGDGNISMHNNRYRLRVIHGYNQKEYCEWKANIFNTKIEFIEKNGFSSKKAVRFTTKTFDLPNEIPKNKTTCPQWIIDKIDYRAIAIWYMDDGSINKKATNITISTCSFDEDTQKRLVEKLNSLGIDCKYFKSKYFYIRINEKGVKKLISEIYKYMHPSIKYKLETQSFVKFVEDLNKVKMLNDGIINFNNVIFNDLNNIPKNLLKDNQYVKYKYLNEQESLALYKICDKCEKLCFHNYLRIGKYDYISCKNCKKVNNKVDYNYNITDMNKYQWNNQFLDYGFCRITKTELCEMKKAYENVFDIEVEDNHNFVVCGINSTGVIVHNCHHYASPVFSRGLQKCGAPYIFALSATPFRPDKLTKVLFWNMGNIYYRQKTKVNKQVICKIFRFKSKDKLFIEKKQWRNGEMKASHTKMINNFVQIKSRNQQIINILNELRKYPERKVLVLSGRKEHLKYLKDSIDQKIGEDIESGILEPFEYRTYYYMGGMKPRQRKEAEDYGDMLFGTYDMAHEGLDIDRLNTIVLATSKKNIVQSVGRVMRKILKIGDLRPLIIDMRDEISIYKNQGDKRIKQYKKGKYKIENYYIQDDKILTLDEFLIDEYNMKKDEIKEYKQEHPDEEYIAKWENILDLQKVQEEDEKLNANAEIIELDPNDEDIDKDSDDEKELDDEEEDSDDEDNNKFKKVNYQNYLF